MTRPIIFDLDGCLVESEVLSLGAIAEIARQLGAQDIDEQEMCGQLLGLKMSKIAGWIEERAGRPAPADFAERIDADLMARYPAELMPVNGAEAMLSSLTAKGAPIALATGSSIARMRVALETTGFDRFFEGRACSSDQVANGKPAPDLFLFATNLIGQDPRDCLVLEDSPHGVQGAVKAGMTAIGFVGGGHLTGLRASHAAKLMAAGCTLVIEDLAELVDLADDGSRLGL